MTPPPMTTARALPGKFWDAIAGSGDSFGLPTLPTKTHKLPTLFGDDDFPAEIAPGGGERPIRHAIDNHAGAFIHIRHAERGAPRELGLVGHEIGPAGEDHLSARLRRDDRIVC